MQVGFWDTRPQRKKNEMALVNCKECGARVSETARACPSCGFSNGKFLNRSRVAAFWLALLLGSFGAHKFYLGQNKTAVLYLVFFWTGIPFILGIIDAIIILLNKQSDFTGSIQASQPNRPTSNDFAGSAGGKRILFALIALLALFVLILGVSVGSKRDSARDANTYPGAETNSSTETTDIPDCSIIRTDITMLRTSFRDGTDTPQQVSWLLDAASADFGKAAESFTGSTSDWLNKMSELAEKVRSYILQGSPSDGPQALDQLFANMDLVEQFCN